MKRFMALYTGDWKAVKRHVERFTTEEQREAVRRQGEEALREWVQQHAASIVDMGGPLGTTKRVTKDGIADARNLIVAYVVVQAESQEAAAKMFLGHPHFTIFLGDAVEIMECLPIPERVRPARG